MKLFEIKLRDHFGCIFVGLRLFCCWSDLTVCCKALLFPFLSVLGFVDPLSLNNNACISALHMNLITTYGLWLCAGGLSWARGTLVRPRGSCTDTRDYDYEWLAQFRLRCKMDRF